MNLYKTNHDLQAPSRSHLGHTGGHMGKGFFISFTMTGLFFLVVAILKTFLPNDGWHRWFYSFFVGAIQIVWVIPLLLLFRRQPRTRHGLLIGTGIIFLASLCFVLYGLYRFYLNYPEAF